VRRGSGIFDSLVSVLFCFEDLVEIGAFGGRGAKRRELLGGNIEVAVDASLTAIDDGEDSGFVVVIHGGDDGGRHWGIDSRKLRMQ
jgi:hypothetical protein